MRIVVLLYVLLGGLLAMLPLVQVLHVESSALVATAAFFASGLQACRAFQDDATRLGRVLRNHLAALAVPLAWLTVSMLWATNCAYLTGLGVYVLFPGVTVVFAVTLAFALAPIRRSGLLLVLTGLAILIAGPVYDLGFHPQFYTYNHVFGGVLGPIYDEQLAFRSGLFVFRGLTLLWAALFVTVGVALRSRQLRQAAWTAGGGLAVLIAVVYVFSASLGLNTTPAVLQDALGGHHRTDRVDVYYDPASMTPEEVRVLADDYAFEVVRQREKLRMRPGDAPGRIQTYIYPTPDVKARLTGARLTSVAPVWLQTPQSHLLQDRVASSYSHEIAHLMARPYGLPGLNASWAAGLVEGWAVALEAPTGETSPHDLVLVAATTDSTGRGDLDARAAAITSQLSPWGFWTGQGAVSYATMGSFVDFLLQRYGPGPLKAVYARANFEAVYGASVRELSLQWADWLRERPQVASGAFDVVTRRFTQPSLFETECPHFVPPAKRDAQDAVRSLAQGDTARAVRRLDDVLATAPDYLDGHVLRARLRLHRGDAAAVIQQLDTLSVDALAVDAPPVSLQYVLAGAFIMDGRSEEARTVLDAAAASLPRSSAWAIASRARLGLLDAVADRPDVARILFGPDSSHVQARRLGNLDEDDAKDDAVRTWIALRWLRAHAFQRAHTAWTQVERPGDVLTPFVSPSRRREWALQVERWRLASSFYAGDVQAARRHLDGVAGRAARYGQDELVKHAWTWHFRIQTAPL